MAQRLNVMAEDQAEGLLRDAGLPVVSGLVFDSLAALTRDAPTLRYPVVLKASASSLLHKTEAGAVRTGLRSQEELVRAAQELEARLPGTGFRFLVQAQAPDGIEAIIGALRDPVFGPAVLFGLGGIHAELYRDTAVAPLPLDRAAARELVRTIRARPLLEGFRGAPPVDLEALVSCLLKVADLVTRDARIVSIDVNPIRLYTTGCLVLDASVVMDEARGDSGGMGTSEALGASHEAAGDMSYEAAGDVSHELAGDVSHAVAGDVSQEVTNNSSVGSGLAQGLERGAARHAGLAAPPEEKERGLSALFAPRGIAVVGAARTPGKAGRVIFENLQRAGFPGGFYPVNPQVETLLGVPCYPSIQAIPQAVDLAILAVPRDRVPEALDDAAAAGARAVIVTSGGFSDAGEEGRGAEMALADQARRLGVRMLGPNSIGIIDPARRINTSITTLEPIPEGNVALVGQTGLFAAGFAAQSFDVPPFGIGRVVCLGNRADLDESDVLETLVDDPHIKAVGLYLEGVRDGARFRAVAGALAAKKPLVVLKGGRSRLGAVAVASHTGSLAGRDEVFWAVIRRLGGIPAGSFAKFFDLLQALSFAARPRGTGLGVISVSGAGCVLAADAAEEVGLDVPALEPGTLETVRTIVPGWAPARNPLDLWSGIEQWGPAEAYSRCGRALLQQGNIDVLLMSFVMIPEADFSPLEVLAPLRKEFPNKPIYGVLFGGGREMVDRWRLELSQCDIPSYLDTEVALRVARGVLYRLFE